MVGGISTIQTMRGISEMMTFNDLYTSLQHLPTNANMRDVYEIIRNERNAVNINWDPTCFCFEIMFNDDKSKRAFFKIDHLNGDIKLWGIDETPWERFGHGEVYRSSDWTDVTSTFYAHKGYWNCWKPKYVGF